MCVHILLAVVRTLFQRLCACMRTCAVFSQDSVEPTSFTFKYIHVHCIIQYRLLSEVHESF